ncbi:hypothetical protein MTR_4g055555 [Medicago truncatula]|uniref:Uncharacterized protein n=1 Tax=Medicago truncatula TaxID=3880 RepID=A0A072UJJ6_MEDTR|nr:hypothetical protein MTR_4g055555 [Medicago truncatula]
MVKATPNVYYYLCHPMVMLHVMSGTQGILFPEDVTEIKEEQQSQKEAQNFDNMTDMTPKSRA